MTVKHVCSGASSYVEFTVDTKINSAYKWGLWITQASRITHKNLQWDLKLLHYRLPVMELGPSKHQQDASRLNFNNNPIINWVG